MALIHMDSCQQPPVQGTQYVLATEPGNGSFDANYQGRQCYDLDNDYLNDQLVVDFPSQEDDTIFFGMRVNFNIFDIQSAGSDNIINFNEGGAATNHVKIIAQDGDGTLGAYRSTNLIGTSAAAAYPQDQWFYLEGRVRIHDTTGLVEIRVDGNTVINLSNVDTRAGGTDGLIDRVRIGSAEGNSVKLRICDFWVANEQGSGNDIRDFTGPVTFQSLRTDAAGNYTNWDVSAGANHDAVDDPVDAIHDGDATYVETAVAERDSYSVANMTGTTNPIAVQVKATARYVNARQDMNTFLRRSSTDNDGATDSAVSIGYGDRAVSIWEEDPIASSAWTVANFNSTEFGIRTT